MADLGDAAKGLVIAMALDELQHPVQVGVGGGVVVLAEEPETLLAVVVHQAAHLEFQTGIHRAMVARFAVA